MTTVLAVAPRDQHLQRGLVERHAVARQVARAVEVHRAEQRREQRVRGQRTQVRRGVEPLL
jgi:hypothetical protein